jgi:plasmid maintenance system antidote protein VapI
MYTFSGDLDIEPRKKIKNYLKERGITTSWLTREIDYEISHVIKSLNGQKKLSDKMRLKINKVLGTDF